MFRAASQTSAVVQFVNRMGGTPEERTFNYLVNCYARAVAESHNSFVDDACRALLLHAQRAVCNAVGLLVEGVFSNRYVGTSLYVDMYVCRAPSPFGALLLRSMLIEQVLTTPFITDLVHTLTAQNDHSPVSLQLLLDAILDAQMFASCTQPQSDEFRLPARALNDLLAIKDATNAKPVKRPMCSVVCVCSLRIMIVCTVGFAPTGCLHRAMAVKCAPTRISARS